MEEDIHNLVLNQGYAYENCLNSFHNMYMPCYFLEIQ